MGSALSISGFEKWTCDLGLCNSIQPRRVQSAVSSGPWLPRKESLLLVLMPEYKLPSGSEAPPPRAFTFCPNFNKNKKQNHIHSSPHKATKTTGINGNFTACWAFSFNKIT